MTRNFPLFYLTVMASAQVGEPQIITLEEIKLLSFLRQNIV